MGMSDDRRHICLNRRHRHVGRDRVGRPMIAFFERWLRRRAVTARPPEPSFAFCGVSFNRATDTTAIDAEFTANVLRQIGSGKYFELRSIE